MKLKNKLLAIGATLLLSCQYSPAYAQVVDNPLNAYGLELTLCESIADFAYISMTAHQNGVSKEAQLSLAPVPTTQEQAVLKDILEEIVHDATIFPIYEDVSDKVEVSERFSKAIYDICKGDK